LWSLKRTASLILLRKRLTLQTTTLQFMNSILISRELWICKVTRLKTIALMSRLEASVQHRRSTLKMHVKNVVLILSTGNICSRMALTLTTLLKIASKTSSTSIGHSRSYKRQI
jgi:hypothetical protein